jgi:hypothetical protein
MDEGENVARDWEMQRKFFVELQNVRFHVRVIDNLYICQNKQSFQFCGTQ